MHIAPARQRWLWAAGILVATLAAYIPCIGGDYIWDDNRHATQNDSQGSLEGLWRMWSVPGATQQYYPMTYTSFWLEYQVWGKNPAPSHVINILLHAGNAIFLWIILRRLGMGPAALLAAAIFALHPVHVESVAWISERKNVLATFFYLAAGLCYLRLAGVDEGGQPDGRSPAPPRGLYLATALLFLCALFSKTVSSSVPAAILLVLWWKRRLSVRHAVAMLPLLVLGAFMGSVTASVEHWHVRAEGPEWDLSFFQRFLIAGRAVWFYLLKLIRPVPLIFIYPRWQVDPSQWWPWLFPLGAVALVGILWVSRHRLGRGPLVAILFFGGTLFPALGFVNVYPMRYSFVADHFQYQASIGIIALGAGLLTEAARQWPRLLPYRWMFITALLAALGIGVMSRCASFQNLERLWTDTLDKNPSAWIAHNNLAVLLLEKDPYLAAGHYTEALRIRPDLHDVYYNLGSLLQRFNFVDEAMEHYRKAIDLNPRGELPRRALAAVLHEQGRTDQALAQYRIARILAPGSRETRMQMAALLASVDRIEEAIDEYRAAADMKPPSAAPRIALANLLLKHGRASEAAEQMQLAASLTPDSPLLENNYALILVGAGRTREAIAHFRRAIQLDPHFAEAYSNLADTLSTLGEWSAAAEAYRGALRLKPDLTHARGRLTEMERKLYLTPTPP